MAESDDDVFFAALENQCKIIESALQSKCNMNQQIREEARQALVELKSSVYRNFVMIKSEKFVEACQGKLERRHVGFAKENV
ncbi:hypothetical protein TNCT_465891 [Trichonephila clavata]|uniref:Uncharacterized protein n=1 Tax=Trichonephila clavata TaxID=2740835 RepID=A0A8X6FIU8_TRICU|nr:hypothetical protein TNCT_465891 [Trichonephila clavata]